MSTFLGENAIWCTSEAESFEPLEPCSLAMPDFEPALLLPTLETVMAAKIRLPEVGARLQLRCSARACAATVAMPLGDLRRALSNLIDNALEATSRGGRVLVTAKAHGDGATVRIHDQGVGMADDVVRSLGKKRLLTGKLGGNGLGVFDAAKRLERYGGRLLVVSAPRRGTHITVTLPLATGYATALVAPVRVRIDDATLRLTRGLEGRTA